MESAFQVNYKYLFKKYTKLQLIIIAILVYYFIVYLYSRHFKYTFIIFYSSVFLYTILKMYFN